ncbi:unnamed protein product [Chrysoparadoxa australica]
MAALGKQEMSSLIQYELRCAVADLSERGLKIAAKWAGEQLVGLPDGLDSSPGGSSYPQADPGESDTRELLFAKALLDVREYQRAAQVLGSDKGMASLEGLSRKAVFIRHYSLYLAGEKRKEEEIIALSDPLERCHVSNLHILQLHDELSTMHEKGQLDAFGLYMFGVVLKQMKITTPSLGGDVCATSVLLESVRAYPWNWSAWLDLASIIIDADMLPEDLPYQKTSPWMYQFFFQHVLLEQQQCQDALQLLEELQVLFPGSTYLLAQTALAHYSMRNFDEANTSFKELQAKDPLRLELLDTFSNVLYVTEQKAELSHLAHTSVQIDKYRPETCCIVGNYYSIKGNHEKAVLYFMRAVKLNRNFLSAWTLMGHEYVEMKNTGAALEHYRRAVDINQKDYRAWYGLGQTYEILQMHLYSMYYYQKAIALRPYDARMWIAMGQCYEKLNRRAEAIKTYERAMANNDREGMSMVRLAKLYSQDGQREKAADCYGRLLQGREQHEEPVEETVEALRFLAYYHKDEKDFDAAASYASRLLQYNGPEKDEAKALLREIRSLEVDVEASVNMSAQMDSSANMSNTMESSATRMSTSMAPDTPARQEQSDADASSFQLSP